MFFVVALLIACFAGKSTWSFVWHQLHQKKYEGIPIIIHSFDVLRVMSNLVMYYTCHWWPSIRSKQFTIISQTNFTLKTCVNSRWAERLIYQFFFLLFRLPPHEVIFDWNAIISINIDDQKKTRRNLKRIQFP
jgi:hypothetical protein